MEKSDMSLNSKGNEDTRSDETKSDSLEDHSASPVSDADNRISFFEEDSSCSKPEDESPSSKPKDESPSRESEDESFCSEPEDELDWDESYYENDLDLKQFCEDTSPLKGIDSRTESLNTDEGYFFQCRSSSNNEGGTPTLAVTLEGEEPAENAFIGSVASSASTSAWNGHDLSIQVREFFAENPVVGEVTDINEVITSRYFTDEFAILLVLSGDENGEVPIRNELEQDTARDFPEPEQDTDRIP